MSHFSTILILHHIGHFAWLLFTLYPALHNEIHSSFLVVYILPNGKNVYEIKSKSLSHNRDDVTVVDYTIQRSDDEAVETLKSPKRVDLERSLSTVGKTLYSRAPVPPPKVNNK